MRPLLQELAHLMQASPGQSFFRYRASFIKAYAHQSSNARTGSISCRFSGPPYMVSFVWGRVRPPFMLESRHAGASTPRFWPSIAGIVRPSLSSELSFLRPLFARALLSYTVWQVVDSLWTSLHGTLCMGRTSIKHFLSAQNTSQNVMC